MNVITRNQIAGNIRRLLVEVGDGLPDGNIRDVDELLDHGEWGEALSLLCEQLYEYEVSISQTQYSLIEQSGAMMGMSVDVWKYLKELVV
jgi:hypothetical protein